MYKAGIYFGLIAAYTINLSISGCWKHCFVSNYIKKRSAALPFHPIYLLFSNEIIEKYSMKILQK